MTTTLKEQNSKLVWVFFSFNIVLFYLLGFSDFFKVEEFEIKSFITVRGVWILIVPLILFILNGIISSDLKASIIFWKWNNPLPACRAFSYYADKDDRIDKNYLIKKYSALPTIPKEQNSLWYKIYKTHQENPVVKKSHKDFLLARDIGSISVLLFVFCGISLLFISPESYKWLYFGFLLLQYLIFAVIAQNHGKRFVCNALAIETSKEI